MYACMHVCMYACMHACMYAVCMRARMHIDICITDTEILRNDWYIHGK